MFRGVSGLGTPLFLAALVLASSAEAHLMPSRRGTLNVVDHAVFGVLSVPVSALHGADDNGNGLLEMEELQRHLADLRAEIDRRFVISDGARLGETVTLDLVLSPEHDAATDRAGQLVALKHVTFPAPIQDLRVACDLFGALSEEQQVTITATRPGETEAGILTPQASTHRFFRAPFATFLDDVRVGAEHVLFGTDHLLFLLTVIVAGLGWRYWLSVVTAFTVAHSLTLGLAMLGYLRLPSRVVEPAIALSIVLFALDNLLRRGEAPGQRIALVFVCGLLHGLGFAGALDSLGLDSAHRVLSLVGFNVGVEVGQSVFLVAALAALAGVRHLLRGIEPFRVTQAVSVVALVVGAVWAVQRIAS
jgi:hydrogenase/urease accessory protein HupE